jgi:hypothetical protein
MAAARTLLPWLPVVLTAALCAAALAAAAFPTTTGARMRLRLAAVALLGVAALSATLWQSWAATQEIARLERNDPAKALAARVTELEAQLSRLQQSTRERSLDPDTAKKLADFLRPFGARKVVVSCVPNDVEAYRYATQIADALKSAGWDANGPETTVIFGNIRAMAINIYDNSGAGSDTAKILVDGFTKLGIPYQSRVPPAQSLDSGTVELFVGAQPAPGSLAEAEPAK